MLYGPLLEGECYNLHKTDIRRLDNGAWIFEKKDSIPWEFDTIKIQGIGGFGIVYQISEKKNGKKYTLKFLGCEGTPEKNKEDHFLWYQDIYRRGVSKEKKNNFRSEIWLLTENHSDHIMPIEPFLCRDIVCYRMPLITNTLDKEIAESPVSLANFSNKKALRFLLIFWKIANTLRGIHLNGIIHRDIAPENIFLDQNHEPLLGDFGLAVTQSVYIRREVAGRLEYMAPEQRKGGPDQKSDVFSLGKIMSQFFCDGNEAWQKFIRKTMSLDLEKRMDSNKMAIALENLIWPRLKNLLKSFLRDKTWDEAISWLHFSWDFIRGKSYELLEKYLQAVWRQKLAIPQVEVHFICRNPLTEPDLCGWELCKKLYRNPSPFLIDIHRMYSCGARRYLVTETITEDYADNAHLIETDQQLIAFAENLAKIFHCEKIYVRSQIGVENLCIAGNQIKLIPWRSRAGNSPVFDLEPHRENESITIARLLYTLWTGEKNGNDIGEEFYDQKEQNGMSPNYVDSFNSILLDAMDGEYQNGFSLTKTLAQNFRREKLRKLRADYNRSYRKVDLCIKELEKWANRYVDLEDDCYRACAMLINVQLGNPVKNHTLTSKTRSHSQLLMDIDTCNQTLVLAHCRPIKVEEICREGVLPGIAGKALEKIEQSSPPLRHHCFSEEQWQKIFKENAGNFRTTEDMEQLSTFIAENIYLEMTTKGKKKVYCLVHQSKKNYIALIARTKDYVQHSKQAFQLTEKVLTLKENLSHYISLENYPIKLKEILLDKKGQVYFDWNHYLGTILEPKNNPEQNSLAIFVISLLYGKKKHPDILQIPLILEKYYRSRRKTTMPEKVFQALSLEFPNLSRLEKYFQKRHNHLFTGELPGDIWWQWPFVRDLAETHAVEVLSHVKNFRLYYKLAPSYQNIQQAGKDEQQLQKLEKQIMALQQKLSVIKQGFLV